MIYYTTEDMRKVTLLPDPRITDKNTNLGFTQNFLIFFFFLFWSLAEMNIISY